jgi:hypothetical protein
MTEVRKSTFGSQGLFATKSYSVGDVLFEESPVIILAPLSDDESKSLMMDLMGDKKESPHKKKSSKESITLWNAIEPPSSVPDRFHGTFRGMVQAGLCFMKRKLDNTEDWESLLQLHHPSQDTASSPEKIILQVSGQAIDYLKAQKPEDSIIDWETLEKIMLIWACNSFEGGRLYPQISRVNHDCNPNAVIQPLEEAQRLVAATDIAEGEEISISYLGLLLYAETSVRRERLQQSKFFECQCPRCSSDEDKAARIPCPTCHP